MEDGANTSRDQEERSGDVADPVDVAPLVAGVSSGRQSAVTTRHLTVDTCTTPGQRHLWARHSPRPGQPLVARLRVRPQTQLSCPETDGVASTGGGGGEQRSVSASGAVKMHQQRSPSSLDGGLVQHRRRRLVLKTTNRSWPTSVGATAAGTAADPRSVHNQSINQFQSGHSSNVHPYSYSYSKFVTLTKCLANCRIRGAGCHWWQIAGTKK